MIKLSTFSSFSSKFVPLSITLFMEADTPNV